MLLHYSIRVLILILNTHCSCLADLFAFNLIFSSEALNNKQFSFWFIVFAFFKGNSTIIDITFFQFIMFPAKFKSLELDSIINFIHELPHNLQKDLRLTILGNLQMKRKSQNWIKTLASVQSPLQKLILGNSGQNFLIFAIYFVTVCLFAQISPQFSTNLNLLTFLTTSKPLSSF